MISKSLVLAALLTALGIGAAKAADLSPGPAMPEVPSTDTMNFFGSGWYIRGDLGYSRPQGPKADYNGTPFDHLSVDGSAVVGAGVGYKINNWFRADITGDYTFSGVTHGSYTIQNCCVFTDRTRIGGWTVLANGYVDLGTWSGITPYIGAGAGYAFTEVSQTLNQQFMTSASGALVPVTDPNTGSPIINSLPTHTKGGFAWALEAGAAVAVAPSVQLDFNYRYLKIADAQIAPDTSGVMARVKSIGAHQFRIGVRYMFDE
jgi:opacity protein-like surface antigen